MIRIQEWSELSDRARDRVSLLDVSDGDPASHSERQHGYRVDGGLYRGYHALFAVRNGDVLSRAAGMDLTLTTRSRDEPLLGVADVVTRPDSLGRGLAPLLIEELHRRASARGIRWAALWTHRTWTAHRRYERLGYRDAYSPAFLLKRIPAAPPSEPPESYALRPCRFRDAALLDSLFERASAQRVGFVRRPAAAFEARFRLGSRRPNTVHLLLHRGDPVGYAVLDADEHQVVCYEAVAVRRADRAALVRLLEKQSAGRWLVFRRTTFVRDLGVWAARRGYSAFPLEHSTLMVKPLAPLPPADRAALMRTFGDPRFSCHTGDMF